MHNEINDELLHISIDKLEEVKRDAILGIDDDKHLNYILKLTDKLMAYIRSLIK